MRQIPVNFAYSGVIANLQISEIVINGTDRDKLVMFSESDFGDGGYMPANSFTLYGSAAIKTLRDALIEAYPLSDEKAKP